MDETQKPTPEPAWAQLPDEELLKLRLCDLGLKIEHTPLHARTQTLLGELAGRGFAHFRPGFYLTTEWLCPDKVPIIGVPFYLAHPRLVQLERSIMLEVEGGTETTCMQLLRHECGHAVNYAYRLYRRTRWRELFGPFSTDYEVSQYSPRPYSRQFVVHLPDYYAQAHPDEDFAETFSVWLTPGLDWRKRYEGWAALRKLEYVDHLMRQIAEAPPLVRSGEKLWPVSRMRSTLATYYRNRKRELTDNYQGYYDEELFRLFTADATGPRADRFLSAHRRALIALVAGWSRSRKYEVDLVLRKFIARAQEVPLHLRQDESHTLAALAACLTTILFDQRS